MGAYVKKIVFLHMHKTAGSDIVAQLYQGRLGKYFFPEDLRAALAYLPADMLRDYYFFYGHAFQRHEINNIPGEKFIFTLLRDPIERLISHYEWLGSYRLDIPARVIPQPETIPVKTMTCDGFFSSSLVERIPAFNNYYTRTIYEFFRGERTDDVEQMLKVAIEGLEAFDFIGLLDCYGESLDHLGRLLDVRLEDAAERPRINATVALPEENELHEGGTRFKVSAATFSKIVEKNWADIELYRRARELARTRFGLPANRFLSGFRTQGVLHKGYDDARFHIDVEGYLQFGPYERLNVGAYSFTFQLRAARYFGEPRTLAADTVVAVLDVVGSDGSDREFARREVTWGEIRFDAFESFTLRVDAALPVSALECRIYSTGACELEAPPVLRMDRDEAGEKVLELRLTTVSG